MRKAATHVWNDSKLEVDYADKLHGIIFAFSRRTRRTNYTAGG